MANRRGTRARLTTAGVGAVVGLVVVGVVVLGVVVLGVVTVTWGPNGYAASTARVKSTTVSTTGPVLGSPPTARPTTLPPPTMFPIVNPVSPFPPLLDCPSPEQAVSRWPLRSRVAQLLAIGADGRSMSASKRLVAEQHVGGLVVRSAPGSAAQLAAGIGALRLVEGALPTTFSVDEEGGRVQVLRSATGSFPSARRLAGNPPEKVRALAGAHYRKVRALGINMILGPVLDVTAENSGVIGDRSFGADPVLVGRLGSATAAGVRDAGMVPAVKHFPGHGGATGDSHSGRVSTLPIDVLRQRDEIPFRMALADGPVAVMVGHLEVPGLSGETPSTLSFATITNELRNSLGFDGLIITDSLSMGAVTTRWKAPAAGVEAIAAGADVALFVTISERDAIGVIDALEYAVSVGRISEGQLNHSVVRVVRSKNLNPCNIDPAALLRDTATAEAAYQASR